MNLTIGINSILGKLQLLVDCLCVNCCVCNYGFKRTNLTEGVDGLATGTSVLLLGTLAVSHMFLVLTADYLNICAIPNVGEIVIFMSTFVFLCWFLWYNSYPAIFMGDTGSLSLGGIRSS